MFSTLLTEFPSFISAISMVTDDERESMGRRVRAEHPSPSFYDAARDLFIKVLEKKLSIEQAITQARHVKEPIDRQCALQILEKSKSFLLTQPAGATLRLPKMELKLPNGKTLSVAPVWLRDCHPCKIMLLHFWQSPLSDLQIQAIAGALLSVIENSNRKYIGFDLDFISVSVPEHASGRRFQVLGWDKIQPLRGSNLELFLRRLCRLWDAYQSRGPRRLRGSDSSVKGSTQGQLSL